ncbi:heterokaryon incompatibility protein-domain-containing protein [Phyllosticta paracitricarpa]
MPSEYQYAPLATPSTIRVIKIEEQKVNNAVACIIRHVEQSEFEYEALSYVWGDPKPTRHVYLGNEADQRNLFPIHENLGRFLNWAWGRRMFDRWIWTDRISLNQDDSEEMAQQIPIMGKIYQNAKQSLTWLGMSEKDGEHMESFEPRGHKGKGSNSTAKNAKLAARRVQSNEYWGRIWMAQEISCAKRVAVWIGNWELEFESLHTTLGQFEKDEDFPIDKQFLLRQGGGESELLQMLLWVTESGFESSRPQDRVYGLLGLVAANSDGTSPVDHIEIDYNKPESEVILDALLVSGLPANERDLPNLAERLFGRDKSIFALFNEYLGSERISVLRKELATYACQAFDAILSIFYYCLCTPPLALHESFSRLRHGGVWGGLSRLTLQESAVITGFMLVLGVAPADFNSESMFESWKDYRKHHAQRSKWMCAKHMRRGRNSPEKGQKYYQWFIERQEDHREWVQERERKHLKWFRQWERGKRPVMQASDETEFTLDERCLEWRYEIECRRRPRMESSDRSREEERQCQPDSISRWQDYLEWFRRTERRPRRLMESYWTFSNFEPNSWRTELMLDPHRIEAACGKYKGWGSCDGSVMIFEIAELGFRLAFQFNDYEDAFMFMHFRLPKPEEEEEEREERQDTTK